MLVELKWTALKDFQSVIRESAYAKGNIKIIPLTKDLHYIMNFKPELKRLKAPSYQLRMALKCLKRQALITL